MQAALIAPSPAARKTAVAALANVGLDIEKLGSDKREKVMIDAIKAQSGAITSFSGEALSYWDAAKLIREAGLELECFIPPPWEQKELDKLSTRQRAALAHVANNARKKSHDAMQLIEQRVKYLGYKRKHLNALLRYIRDDAPIIIHLNLRAVL